MAGGGGGRGGLMTSVLAAIMQNTGSCTFATLMQHTAEGCLMFPEQNALSQSFMLCASMPKSGCASLQNRMHKDVAMIMVNHG